MFDRRTAAKREWSVWWRYASMVGVVELIAWFAGTTVAPAPLGGLFHPLSLLLVVYSLFQVVLLGIAMAVLVRFHVRTLHVWLGAAGASVPLVAAAVLPYEYRVGCFVLAGALSVAWIVVVARTSMRVSDPRTGFLCRACFYDLRGLTCAVCPECGTAVSADGAERQRPTHV